MVTTIAKAGRVACLLVIFPCTDAGAQDKGTSETDKINALIKHIEQLKDAKFVRNGSEYDAKSAAQFLRRKWESNKAEVKTARDFVERVATKSSTSGKPYVIRLSGAKDVPSGDYLLEQLKKLEK